MRDEALRYLPGRPLRDPAYNVLRIEGRAVRERAAEHFSGRLLDIGCGSKPKAAIVGEFVDDHLGLDHPASPHGVSEADLLGSALDLPLADASVDCVLSTAVLEHLEEPGRAVAEACRVLRPGGVAVYTAPFIWHIHEDPRDFYRYTEFGLRHLFESGGFEVEEIVPLSGYWITASAGAGYYIQRFRKGLLAPLVDGVVMAMNLLAPLLDRGRLREERFTWMYLVVARRPVWRVGGGGD